MPRTFLLKKHGKTGAICYTLPKGTTRKQINRLKKIEPRLKGCRSMKCKSDKHALKRFLKRR